MISKYEKIFEHSKEGLLVTNAAGIIETVNPRLIELFGYTNADELLGKKIEILIPTRFTAKHKHHRASFNTNPTHRSMGVGRKLKALRKDNSEFPVEISLSHYKDNGELKIIAFVVDVTTQAKIEDELLKLNSQLENEVQRRVQEINTQNKLLKSIAAHFPTGNIYVINTALEIEWADGQLIRQQGLDDKSLKGELFSKHVPTNFKDKVNAQLSTIFKGETITTELTNAQHYFSLYGVPLEHSAKGVTTALLVELDITKAKQTELEIQKNLAREIKLNEMKSRFVTMASHEFRTPLSAIASSATLIGKYQQDHEQEKRDKHIQRIKRSVADLTVILDDFLSLDKLESDQMGVNLTETHLLDFFQQITDEFSTTLKTNQTLLPTLKINLEKGKIDSAIIKNCCFNLLSNASKYSADNGKIKFLVEADPGLLKISVADTGIGIPKSEQPLLFSRFFRAKNATNIQGTGLGLNIVKRYAELMRGQISFKSELDKGTTFTLTIPLNATT